MINILYIDDDETNRNIVDRILRRAPFEVTLTLAEDGQAGIDHAKAEKPDLILMDFHMPGMNGNPSK